MISSGQRPTSLSIIIDFLEVNPILSVGTIFLIHVHTCTTRLRKKYGRS